MARTHKIEPAAKHVSHSQVSNFLKSTLVSLRFTFFFILSG